MKSLLVIGILCLGVYVWYEYFSPLAKLRGNIRDACMSASYGEGWGDVAKEICDCVDDVVFANIGLFKAYELYEMKVGSALLRKNLDKVNACLPKRKK